jgi:hypothetical protein
MLGFATALRTGALAATLGAALGGCGGSGGGGPGGAVPFVLVVTTLADAGPGSLRAVVNDALLAPGGVEVVVVFDGALAGGTVHLVTPVTPLLDLAIDGSGPGGTPGERITISGDDATHLFEIALGRDVTLRHLVLRDGHTTGDGGAILVGGTLRLEDALVHGNSADVGGGAISSVGGEVHLRRCAFTDNDARWGGAVDLTNALLVAQDSSFTFNNATISGGGALWLIDSHATLVNCTVHGNTASSAVFAQAAAIYAGLNPGQGGSFLELLHCTITGNSSAAATGPAVNVQRIPAVNSVVYVRGTIIAENTGPLNGDFDYHSGDGSGSASISDSILGVGNASTIVWDGINDSVVGTLMVPADPMLSVLTPLFGPGDGRVHRFAQVGSPALDRVAMGDIIAFGAVVGNDQRDRARGGDGFTDAGATDVESP